MITLSDLRARVEKASGPDRELDAAIVAVLNNATVRPYPASDDFGPHDRWQFWSVDGVHFLGSERKFPVPSLSASLDAVVTLIERVMPGCGWQVERLSTKSCDAVLWSADEALSTAIVDGATPPLALLAAFFAVLEAKESSNGD